MVKHLFLVVVLAMTTLFISPAWAEAFSTDPLSGLDVQTEKGLQMQTVLPTQPQPESALEYFLVCYSEAAWYSEAKVKAGSKAVINLRGGNSADETFARLGITREIDGLLSVGWIGTTRKESGNSSAAYLILSPGKANIKTILPTDGGNKQLVLKWYLEGESFITGTLTENGKPEWGMKLSENGTTLSLGYETSADNLTIAVARKYGRYEIECGVSTIDDDQSPFMSLTIE